jgi:hypothetical protein
MISTADKLARLYLENITVKIRAPQISFLCEVVFLIPLNNS